MSEQKIYHCVSCGYTGHDTGWKLGHGVDDGYACPNECKFDDGSKLDGQYIEMLEYDPEDDSLPNASEAEHAKALAAVHKFQRKSKPMSPLADIIFNSWVDGARLAGAM